MLKSADDTHAQLVPSCCCALINCKNAKSISATLQHRKVGLNPPYLSQRPSFDNRVGAKPFPDRIRGLFGLGPFARIRVQEVTLAVSAFG